MTIESFLDPPPAERARALAEFERQFHYPLGPGRSFRIEHGDDYARFYRAIGDARCFLTLANDRVLGVLAVAVRPLLLPDGSAVQAAYIGDLKLAPEARHSTALYRLVRTAEVWARERAEVAFGVVMDGTAAVPPRYTGRAGIVPFDAVAHLMVYRFACAAGSPVCGSIAEVREEEGRACYRRLSLGRFACPAGTPAERSSIAPLWLLAEDGAACGCLEDTRRAKRLLTDDGEMISAHLSCFAWRDARAGAQLLRAALGRAAALGFPALFVCVDARDMTDLEGALPGIAAIRAPATVYAYVLPAGSAWNLNSAEI